MDCSPLGSSVRHSPGKNTGVGCHFFLQRMFLTPGSNLCLLISCTGRQVLYHCCHLGSPHTGWKKRNLLEPNMEQQTGSKLGKEYNKVVQGGILSPCSLTYMQSIWCEMPGWVNHKLELRLLGKISITPNKQMTLLLWQKVKRTAESWWSWKRKVKKLA